MEKVQSSTIAVERQMMDPASVKVITALTLNPINIKGNLFLHAVIPEHMRKDTLLQTIRHY